MEQIVSPTNLTLYRVVCGGDGKVYCCGEKGIIISGREQKWEVIDQDETDETFWGATWFKDHLYLSTANGLFILKNQNWNL